MIYLLRVSGHLPRGLEAILQLCKVCPYSGGVVLVK